MYGKVMGTKFNINPLLQQHRSQISIVHPTRMNVILASKSWQYVTLIICTFAVFLHISGVISVS